MKHKHYDCIVAWADGAKIETSEDGLVWSHVQHPRWYEDMQYRIEQSPVIEVKYFINEIYCDENGNFTKDVFTEFKPDLESWNLKITYQDGKAVKAELPE